MPSVLAPSFMQPIYITFVLIVIVLDIVDPPLGTGMLAAAYLLLGILRESIKLYPYVSEFNRFIPTSGMFWPHSPRTLMVYSKFIFGML